MAASSEDKLDKDNFTLWFSIINQFGKEQAGCWQRKTSINIRWYFVYFICFCLLLKWLLLSCKRRLDGYKGYLSMQTDISSPVADLILLSVTDIIIFVGEIDLSTALLVLGT